MYRYGIKKLMENKEKLTKEEERHKEEIKSHRMCAKNTGERVKA